MSVLAIETATVVCGAAIVEKGVVTAEQAVEASQVHSQKIMGLIDQVLRSANHNMNALDGIAVSIGPGSFTGLRIGLSTAKGLAYALEKPVAAVSTLEALARNITLGSTCSREELIVSLIDARRDEMYAAGYRIADARFDEVFPPCAVNGDALYKLLEKEAQILLGGDAAEKFSRYVALRHPEDLQRFTMAPKEKSKCSAAAVGIIGEALIGRGVVGDTASLEPLYVKEFYTKSKTEVAGLA